MQTRLFRICIKAIQRHTRLAYVLGLPLRHDRRRGLKGTQLFILNKLGHAGTVGALNTEAIQRFIKRLRVGATVADDGIGGFSAFFGIVVGRHEYIAIAAGHADSIIVLDGYIGLNVGSGIVVTDGIDRQNTPGLIDSIADNIQLAICICAICLCGVSWAWFTASTSTGTTQIQAASYSVNVSAENESVKIASESGTFTVTFTTAGSYTITLTPSGTASTGYCKINFADVDHYTDQLTSDSLRFTVNADADSKLTITPQWGCYSGTATIQGGDVITVAADGSQQSNTQTPDRRVTAGPSTEPSTEPTAPTTPTTPTTPSSTPTESETSTPEPSAHAPIPAQSETPDTAQNPAPETATPESTTAAQTEPPTTVESEATE